MLIFIYLVRNVSVNTSTDDLSVQHLFKLSAFPLHCTAKVKFFTLMVLQASVLVTNHSKSLSPAGQLTLAVSVSTIVPPKLIR